MKYYLIVGEASGDLHASHLMAAFEGGGLASGVPFLRRRPHGCSGRCDGEALQRVGVYGVHSRTAASAHHLCQYERCKEDIVTWQPDVLILVDYPALIWI